MNMRVLLTLMTLVLLAVAMAGCTGDSGSGGSSSAKFQDSTGSQTFTGYCGDPEHGDQPDTVTFNIPASTAGNGSGEEPPPESPGEFGKVTFSRTYTSAGLQSQSMADEGSNIEMRIYSITVVLTWIDTDGSNSDPDEFELTLSCGEESGQETGAGDSSSGGKIELTLGANGSAEDPDVYMDDSATITVRCIEAGFTADTKNFGLIRLGAHDKGNEFTLKVDYKAWEK